MQDVIKQLLHKHYEQRRKSIIKTNEKWQWDYKCDETNLFDSKQIADQILALGLPKDRPPLLSDEELNKAFDSAFDEPVDFDHEPTPEEVINIRFRAIAQAQIKAIYEGK